MQEDIRELRKKTIEKFAKAISDKLPGSTALSMKTDPL